MSKKEKLVKRLLSRPKDFPFEEMKTLLAYLGYELRQESGGSGVKFSKENSNEVINFHKPHPDGILKKYILDQVLDMINPLSYKNYNGTVEFSSDDNCLFGKVVGIKSLLSYEGQSIKELKEDFERTVDEYLEDCQERGIAPE